jgi:alpha-ribazole phosphatase/probable phosphoglycerate mutase
LSRLAIVFETHALTTDNERGVATGWNGGALSERGRLLASELGRRRRDDGLDLVVSSDLNRSIETVQIAFGDERTPVQLDWRLREVDYGRLTGSGSAALARGEHVETRFPGGESYRNVVDRVARFLAELVERRPAGRVLLVGHTATRWALDHLLDGVPLEGLVDAPFAWRHGWDYMVDGRRLEGAFA